MRQIYWCWLWKVIHSFKQRVTTSIDDGPSAWVGFAYVRSVGIVLEAFPEAAKLEDSLVSTPLFTFLQRVYRPERSKLFQTDPKTPQECPKGSGQPVPATTDLVESLFRAYPEACEVVCESGASPISILISEIANYSLSLDHIFENDTGHTTDSSTILFCKFWLGNGVK